MELTLMEYDNLVLTVDSGAVESITPSARVDADRQVVGEEYLIRLKDGRFAAWKTKE